MSRYLDDKKKENIAKRASYKCEYCLIHKDDTFFPCQIDHIISIKHGGGNDEENLAYSCIYCNRNKGSDLGSVLLPDTTLVRFYNPRIDQWHDHFSIEEGMIIGKTAIGKVTIKVLGLNTPERVLERQELQAVGRYPQY